MPQSNFPKDFLWGASTSSHQVEGSTHNQWSEWEKTHSERLAKDAKSRLAHLYTMGNPLDWEHIAPHATSSDNYLSGEGVDHFKLYKDDFRLLQSLNMNAFRFSIEWSRLEPEPGKWDPEAIAHYHRYIAELTKLHIEPVVTLWHWTIPPWFAEKGGFAKAQNLADFYNYVTKISQEFGTELRYILILNEPNVYAFASYMVGFWPPEQKNITTGLKVYKNLATAHKKAYNILKDTHPQLEVGTAITLLQTYAHNRRNPLNHMAIRGRDYLWNWWFLNRIHHHLDFIGLNFYATEHVDWRLRKKNPPGRHNDLGWYMEPSALYDILRQTSRRYAMPIIITESGLADAQDAHRKWWLKETLAAMQKALTAGVQLKGYLHWSLLDNFEWAYGWWPKFGLVEVDRTTMKRSVRKSAQWFGKEIGRLRG